MKYYATKWLCSATVRRNGLWGRCLKRVLLPLDTGHMAESARSRARRVIHIGVICSEIYSFLPHEHITLLFTNMILLDAPTSPMPPLLGQLLNYIQTTSIYSNIWPPASWSIFNRAVRTNYDCERWHRRLKIRRHISLFINWFKSYTGRHGFG